MSESGFRREDFAHKRSRELVNTYQVIAFEELEPQQMGRSRGMRKSIKVRLPFNQFLLLQVELH
jgi:putative transposase